jgi:hypothetical protein
MDQAQQNAAARFLSVLVGLAFVLFGAFLLFAFGHDYTRDRSFASWTKVDGTVVKARRGLSPGDRSMSTFEP